MSITLSEKHGVNPTMTICFFCGEEKGEIALLGKLPEDAEAPKYAVIDYEPCDKCKEQMDKGVIILEVTTDSFEDNRPPIQDNLYPTGNWAVITEEAAKKMFNTDKKALLVDKELMNTILQSQA